jgi:hypothetical protein
MGEARRKREAVLSGPCPCGSKKAARLGCFTGREWHKPATTLGLTSLPPSSSVAKCYMKELGSCVAPISGEHIISESVIRVLMGDGEFSIAGLPWLTPDEEKILAPQSLRTNCLCTKHNSALHPLDDAAQYFFASLKSYLERDEGMRHALVSGHDVERWLLKTRQSRCGFKESCKGADTPFRCILTGLSDTRHARRPAPLAGGGRTLLHDEYRRPDVKSPALPVAAAHKRPRRY